MSALSRSLLVALVLVGCTGTLGEGRSRFAHTTREPERPERRARDEPLRFEDGRALAEAFASLGEPELVALIEAAFEGSPELRSSLVRVQAAWALADQGRAARMPTVSGTASASMGRSITGGIGSLDVRSITLSLPVSYEVDLFGRYAAEHLSARFEAEASVADAQAAALSLAAEIAEAYFDVLRARAMRALLEAQRQSAESHLALVRERERRGLVGAGDVHSQARVVAGLDADLALLVGEEQVAKRRLAVLLGRDEPPEIEGRALAATAPIAIEGFDASVLAERPDLRAAWLRLEAADASVAAAVRAQMPSLRITAAPGWTAIHSESQLGERSGRGFTWSLGAQLNVPIFDGLRGPSVARERRLRTEASLATYEALLLTARAEVENALVLDAQRRIALEAITAQRALASEERAVAESRYRAGIESNVTVLVAMDAERALERARLEAMRALYAHRVQLVRALGGAP